MQIDQPYAFAYTTIADDGPNHGFKYLTSATNAATFKYQISPDLEITSSTFYMAQCGNYSQQNPNGYIGGAQLLSNVREHEYGTTLGHYQQYLAAQQTPSNNVGVGAEMQIAGPPTSVAAFTASVQSNLDARAAVITSATVADSACNSDTRYDTSCAFRGFINFAPYQPC